MTSTSGIYSENLMEEFVGDNGSLLSLQPWLFSRKKHFRDEDSDGSGRWSCEWSGFSFTNQGSPGRSNPVSNWNSTKNRREHRYNFRPVTFSENFFTSHLCGEDFGVEEYNSSSPPSSPLKNERPPFHMDRSRAMSRLGNDFLGEQPENRCYREIGSSRSSGHVPSNQVLCSFPGELTTVIGVPHLPHPALRKTKGKSQKARPGTIDTSCSKNLCKASFPQGSFDGMFLFLLGVSIGVASSILSNRMELEKLNKLLKDNESLVQDLHEELEMKDLLVVKELANETHGNKELKHHNLGISINALENQSSEWHPALLKMNEYDHACLTKVGENPEALSEIEAELEAELERLEQNINAFNVGQRISDLSEFDSEIIGDVVEGELREDLLNNGASECHKACNRDMSTSPTTQAYNANYSVSPKELSLRLHQVIESRLEKRIKELESALEQSQMKLRLAETERLSTMPVSSSYSSGVASPNHDSPTSLQQKHSSPLCLNLSEEQSQANLQLAEAKMFRSEPPAFSSSDAASPSSNHDHPATLQQKESSCPSCLDLSVDALVAHGEAYEEFMKLTEPGDEKEQAWKQMLWTGSDGDDEDGFDDAGKDLIQKIVEKTKQGSPALINAQRMFFLMDL